MKTYLILGASSDVGMAYIEKLIEADEEMNVVAVYRTMSDRFADIIAKESKINIVSMHADLSIEEDVEALIQNIKEEELIPTHILHLAASKLDYMKIKNWDNKKMKEDMQISVYSFARICQEFLPAMAKNKYGKVVAMISAAVLGKPPKYMSDYVTCKSALWGFVKGAAAEYADKGLNINGISPNMMETKFLEAVDERIVAMAAEGSANKRNVSIQETVDSISFLMSDEASYINGINLNLSGGDYM